MSVRFISSFGLAIVLTACTADRPDTIEASGTIEGTDITVASEVMGKVKAALVQEGTRVNAGDTLLIIDDTEYRLQLRQADAAVAVADAQYRLALEGSRKEDILQAEVLFKNAEADYNRMKELLSAQAVTQRQFDDAHARYVAAEQTYRKLVTGLRKPEVDAAHARRDQAAAQAEQIRKRLRDCIIFAPAAATVTHRVVEPGELAVPGSALFKLTNLDRVKLTIYVNEQNLGQVKLGQRADVRIDGMPDRVFEGQVTYISPVAEFTPKNVQTKEERTKLVFGVKVEVDNPDGTLKPGLPADATLPISSR